MHPEQVKIFKKMSPSKKLEIAAQLYDSAREFKTAMIRRGNPELTEEEVKKKVRDIFLYASS
jgi:hypothetical protein